MTVYEGSGYSDPVAMGYSYLHKQPFFIRDRGGKLFEIEDILAITLFYAINFYFQIIVFIMIFSLSFPYFTNAFNIILLPVIIFFHLALFLFSFHYKYRLQSFFSKTWFLFPLEYLLSKKMKLYKLNKNHLVFYAKQTFSFKYSASGDFKKFLESVEWQITQDVHRGVLKKLYKTKRISLKEYLGYRFLPVGGGIRRYDFWFSEIPKTGYLKIEVF